MNFLRIFAGVIAALICLVSGGCTLFFIAAAFNHGGADMAGFVALAVVICIASGAAARMLLNRPDKPDNKA